MKTMTFKEWIISTEDGVDIEWVNNFLNDLIHTSYHSGDCTKESHPCSLCTLEVLLKEYYEYQKEITNDKIS
jgi:hypothetical protein